MRLPEFPKVIKKGSVSVTIYSTPSKGNPNYTLSYYQEGRRKRETHADYSVILKRADEVLDDLIEARPPEEGALKAVERNEYLRIKVIADKIKKPLDVIVRHYAEAMKILGSDLVIEAAREYAKRHPGQPTLILVADLVTEFLAEKEKQGRGKRTLETLKSHCKRFGDNVKMNIGEVTASDVEKFLDDLKVGPRTHDNILNSINTLVEYAKRKRYLASDYDEICRIVRLDCDDDGAIEIFDLEEMQALINAAGELLLVFIAIGGFAGLRSSEILRLDWADVKFASDCIIVQQGKVKKRGKSRRIVPMVPNLKELLTPFAQKTGLVWPFSKPYLYETLTELSTKAKVKWKANALRHSYVSYRVADIKNIPQVALESGNSPQIIDSNYRELVTEKDAKTWFAIKKTTETTDDSKTMAEKKPVKKKQTPDTQKSDLKPIP